jgi:hypothetical protein
VGAGGPRGSTHHGRAGGHAWGVWECVGEVHAHCCSPALSHPRRPARRQARPPTHPYGPAPGPQARRPMAEPRASTIRTRQPIRLLAREGLWSLLCKNGRAQQLAPLRTCWQASSSGPSSIRQTLPPAAAAHTAPPLPQSTSSAAAAAAAVAAASAAAGGPALGGTLPAPAAGAGQQVAGRWLAGGWHSPETLPAVDPSTTQGGGSRRPPPGGGGSTSSGTSPAACAPRPVGALRLRACLPSPPPTPNNAAGAAVARPGQARPGQASPGAGARPGAGTCQARPGAGTCTGLHTVTRGL